jgi:Domain of unknown function (DUF4190)/zinc-ribbon domain
MYCTQCGTANSDELRFCSNCGAPMVRRGDTPQNRAPSVSGQTPYPGDKAESPYPAPYPGYRAESPYPGYRAESPYPAFPGAPAYPMHSKEGSASGRAVISMILSIISPFTCWLFLSIPGLILGKMEMNAIRDGQAPKAGETFAKIGFYVGLAVTVLSLVIPVIWLFFLVITS